MPELLYVNLGSKDSGCNAELWRQQWNNLCDKRNLLPDQQLNLEDLATGRWLYPT